MNIEQMAKDLDETTTRLNRYFEQVAEWYIAIPASDPNTATRRAKAGQLRERLNRARVAMGAVKVQRGQGEAPMLLPALQTEGAMDLERMSQDLDRTAERMNTYYRRVEAWLSGVGRLDPIRDRVAALMERTRVARMAVIGAREAAKKVAPADYRVDEILY